MSFVVKASGVRNSTNMGKQIEKTIGDHNEEDNSGAEDGDYDDSDYELKDKYQASFADLLGLVSITDFKESVQYHDVHFRFRNTMFLAIFAPPPNLI